MAFVPDGDHAEHVFSLQGLFLQLFTGSLGQIVQGNIQRGGQPAGQFQIRYAFPAFPFGDGLAGYANLFRQGFLGQTPLFPKNLNVLINHPFPTFRTKL